MNPASRMSIFLHAILPACCAAVALVLPQRVLAQDETITKQTFTYKIVHSPTSKLEADVLRMPDAVVRPVIVYIHGGALMMGGRSLSTKPGSLAETMIKAGHVVVSIDYRLAPQVKLPVIIEDVQDACKWVREKGPKLFRIDPQQMAVMGHSAGGYLTQVTGYRVEPRPYALVSFWGYGDIAGAWYSRPDPFYRKQPLVSKEEADNSGGGRLYLYCRQQGLWPKVVTGHDPDIEPNAFDPFCPARNISKDYPPTMLIHGDKDTDVPYDLAVMMTKELAAHDVEHEFITIANGGHGFGRNNREVERRTYAQVVQFLEKQRRK